MYAREEKPTLIFVSSAPDKKLEGSAIVKESKNEALGTIEWTLANGLKVVIKPTQFKADEVFVVMNAHFGQSSLSDELYWTSAMLPTMMGRMGISKFSATDLRKQLSGKNASVQISPDDYETSVVANGSPNDLETIMQLLYLQFTEPRFSKEDFDVAMSQLKPYVENMQTNPDYISSVERQKTLYGRLLLHCSTRLSSSLWSLLMRRCSRMPQTSLPIS